MKIPKEKFEKTSRWIKRNARPLESALWSYHFEDRNDERVIECIEAFQNEDGGFGHGIEPDFWSPHSSPMASWAAGQILLDIEAKPELNVVQKLVNYLESSYMHEKYMWPSVMPSNNDYPHAPWWHWTENVQDNWSYNPSAELAGFLLHWSAPGSSAAEIGWKTVKSAIDYLMKADEMDRHQINNFQQLVKLMPGQETEFDSRIHYSLKETAEKVNALAYQAAGKSKAVWSEGYVATPLDFAEQPEDFLSMEFGTYINDNLDFYIEQLSNEGTWDINWSWGQFENEFPVARNHWKGILAVKRYKILHSFGRLDD
ncbi:MULTISPECIES: hypothetical protein [unclassified Cytobacillus]|uniref:hypothetical protein n=1 Tax=unclassified Cytobacillus TaxID=2675268 RepID=UPI001359F63E|nr:hypothetical protein [Cytobacillus sp. AMY 15.2]KAF0819906.1 hypothetical protein KIS4809_1178 [Bacillus sp. ZZV12-4809]MCM3092225.1 hypothetical protein [Cytobacillus sp. AMY 15.2]